MGPIATMGSMRLTPWEEERLLIFTAAELARRHRASGLALNAPEAIALMCDAMLEAARAGASYGEVEAAAREAVSPDEVMPGVRELIEDVRLEVLLGDGTRLVVVLDPLGRPGRAMAGDGPGAIRAPDEAGDRRPAGRWRRRRRSSSPSAASRARVIRVSSHYPFDRVNPRLVFDRDAARGFRLDLPAGRVRALVAGRDADRPPRPVRRRRDGRRPRRARMTRLSPADRLARYGPSTGDRVRLADTDLWVRVAEDRQAPGDEPIWGYAKTIRPRSAQGRPGPSELDVVIAGALVLDPVIGAVKADIGIKDGRIVGVGRAGQRGDQRRDRAADRPAHPADHGLRPDRDARARSTATSTRSARPSCRPRCRVA